MVDRKPVFVGHSFSVTTEAMKFEKPALEAAVDSGNVQTATLNSPERMVSKEKSYDDRYQTPTASERDSRMQ